MMLSVLTMMVGAMSPGANAAQDAPCVQDANVDTCWSAGVAAEKRGDKVAALAAYDRSCEAGFQQGGCYEAGKLYLTDPALRDAAMGERRMAAVCASDDVGIGPYACRYLGVMYRDGTSGAPQPGAAFAALSKACFLHNPAPFIDGEGCAQLARSVPARGAVRLKTGAAWDRDYLAWLGLAMGCTDARPDLCDQARQRYRAAAAAKAGWVARCDEEVAEEDEKMRCAALAGVPKDQSFEARQVQRLQLVSLFRTATIGLRDQ